MVLGGNRYLLGDERMLTVIILFPVIFLFLNVINQWTVSPVQRLNLHRRARLAQRLWSHLFGFPILLASSLCIVLFYEGNVCLLYLRIQGMVV